MMRCLLAGVLLAASASAWGQPTSPSTPTIADLVRDADGDRVPDVLGIDATVHGVVVSAPRTFGRVGPSLYVQDATGGIAVSLEDDAYRPFAPGDRVAVTGTLVFAQGVAALDGAALDVLGGGTLPGPLPYDSADPERVENLLTEVEGVVVAHNRVEAGDALTLTLDDRSILVAFTFADADAAPDLSVYDPGDRIRIVGVAGQFDRNAPYEDSYQIYPRAQADVSRVGIPMGAYRQGVFVVLGLLLIVGLWAETLRRQVQRRVDDLQRSEARYGTVVDLASDPIFLHDPDGTNLEMNRAARVAVGLGPDDATPPVMDLIHPDDHQAARDHRDRLLREGQSRAEVRLLCQEGPRFFEFDSQLIRLEEDVQVLSLARDVEARRATERRLIEARESAEETARLKSAFLASMSHEIRTPLTAVIGFADLLRYEVGDDQLDLVLAIEAGGTRLLNTLNSVLDLAQLDAGGEALVPKPLDLVAHIRDSLRVLAPMAEGRGLSVRLDTPVDALSATLDAGAFDRVLTNLVGNAVKFTDAGGVTVGLQPEGEQVILTVADTGIGIDAAFLPSLFSEFRQESEGYQRSHEGSGLGLAITQRLVHLMRGTITVESEKGVGTTFRVTLPLQPEADRPEVDRPEGDRPEERDAPARIRGTGQAGPPTLAVPSG